MQNPFCHTWAQHLLLWWQWDGFWCRSRLPYAAPACSVNLSVRSFLLFLAVSCLVASVGVVVSSFVAALVQERPAPPALRCTTSISVVPRSRRYDRPNHLFLLLFFFFAFLFVYSPFLPPIADCRVCAGRSVPRRKPAFGSCPVTESHFLKAEHHHQLSFFSDLVFAYLQPRLHTRRIFFFILHSFSASCPAFVFILPLKNHWPSCLASSNCTTATH